MIKVVKTVKEIIKSYPEAIKKNRRLDKQLSYEII